MLYIPELKILEVQNFAFSTTPVTTGELTEADRQAYLSELATLTNEELKARLVSARQERARWELARRELLRAKQTIHEVTRMTADDAIKEAEAFLGAQQQAEEGFDFSTAQPVTEEFDFSTAQPVAFVEYQLGSGEYKFYVRTTRPFRSDEERKQIQTTVAKIMADSNTKKMRLKDNPSKTIWYDIPWSLVTVVYGRQTTLGTVVSVFGSLVITVICLALYFPLFRAIFNLCRKKRILRT